MFSPFFFRLLQNLLTLSSREREGEIAVSLPLSLEREFIDPHCSYGNLDRDREIQLYPFVCYNGLCPCLKKPVVIESKKESPSQARLHQIPSQRTAPLESPEAPKQHQDKPAAYQKPTLHCTGTEHERGPQQAKQQLHCIQARRRRVPPEAPVGPDKPRREAH